ncbi:MAG TPA: ABC transporter permease [Caulobacterales bacterium]|nr:ABC transporter permease [Caulobacterales bacterium]
MGSLIQQCGAVTMLNLRSIPQRLAMSLSTVAAVALAVSVLLGFFALSNGFTQTMQGSGANDVAMVYRKNSTSELSSVLLSDQIRILSAGPGIVQRNGHPFISPELYLIVDGVKRSTGTAANMPLRGMEQDGLAIRTNAHLVEGRMFQPGTNEIVVGRALLREFAGFELNQTVRLGSNTWKVVGVFEAPGTVFESELWADARVVQSLFNRGSSYQILRVKLANARAVAAFKRFAESDPRLQLEAQSEHDYYAKQSSGTVSLIQFLGIPLGFFMALGALAGALNTMYASVATRAAEIATLRIIGFSRFAAFFGTLVEAIALSLIGAIVGIVFCFLFFNNMTASTLGSSFTQVVFQLKLSPAIAAGALITAFFIGLIGGIFPGISAATKRAQVQLAAAQ